VAVKAKLDVWANTERDLLHLRGRIAYWEKRISLARHEGAHKRMTLRKFAWAELARLVARGGVQVFQPNSDIFERAFSQACAVSRQMTGSPPKKSSGNPVRAVGVRRSRATD